MAKVDWNAAVLILDTLSDDRLSFTELDDCICREFGRDVVQMSLSLLARQALISVFAVTPGHSSFDEVDAEERDKRIEAFFEIAKAERNNAVANRMDLTAKGENLLRLIGIGRRPL